MENDCTVKQRLDPLPFLVSGFRVTDIIINFRKEKKGKEHVLAKESLAVGLLVSFYCPGEFEGMPSKWLENKKMIFRGATAT